MKEIHDLDDFMTDYSVCRLSLEHAKTDFDYFLGVCDEMGLALPVTARDRVQKRLDSMRAALQYSKSLEELGEDCEPCP